MKQIRPRRLAGGRFSRSESAQSCHALPEYTSPGRYDVGLRDEVGNREFNPPSLRGAEQPRFILARRPINVARGRFPEGEASARVGADSAGNHRPRGFLENALSLSILSAGPEKARILISRSTQGRATRLDCQPAAHLSVTRLRPPRAAPHRPGFAFMKPIDRPRASIERFRPWVICSLTAVGLVLPGGSTSSAAEGQVKSAGKVDYNRDVRPILARNCFACHGQDEAKRAKGLRLDRRDAAVQSPQERRCRGCSRRCGIERIDRAHHGAR